MKRFIIEVSLFLLPLIGVILGYEYYYYSSEQYKERGNATEVYVAIKRSKIKQYKKKLILGDSVGCQLFPENNDSVTSLACNQAITMAGMFFLLSNYIETNKDSLPEEVILLCTPGALHNYLDKYSYQYFLKPFDQREYSKWTTPLLKDRIHEVKLWWTANLPVIRSNNFTTRYRLSEKKYTYISPLSKQYIIKIDSLLSANNISFRMQSVPIDVLHKTELDSLLRKSAKEGELPERLLIPFIESMCYMPSSAYVDEIHFKQEALDTIRRQQFVGKNNPIYQPY